MAAPRPRIQPGAGVGGTLASDEEKARRLAIEDQLERWFFQETRIAWAEDALRRCDRILSEVTLPDVLDSFTARREEARAIYDDAREQLQQRAAALAELTDIERVIVQRHYRLPRQTITEIACTMKRDSSSIRYHLRHALATLAAYFARNNAGAPG